jgi:hypothetical protein
MHDLGSTTTNEFSATTTNLAHDMAARILWYMYVTGLQLSTSRSQRRFKKRLHSLNPAATCWRRHLEEDSEPFVCPDHGLMWARPIFRVTKGVYSVFSAACSPPAWGKLEQRRASAPWSYSSSGSVRLSAAGCRLSTSERDFIGELQKPSPLDTALWGQHMQLPGFQSWVCEPTIE